MQKGRCLSPLINGTGRFGRLCCLRSHRWGLPLSMAPLKGWPVNDGKVRRKVCRVTRNASKRFGVSKQHKGMQIVMMDWIELNEITLHFLILPRCLYQNETLNHLKQVQYKALFLWWEDSMLGITCNFFLNRQAWRKMLAPREVWKKNFPFSSGDLAGTSSSSLTLQLSCHGSQGRYGILQLEEILHHEPHEASA